MSAAAARERRPRGTSERALCGACAMNREIMPTAAARERRPRGTSERAPCLDNYARHGGAGAPSAWRRRFRGTSGAPGGVRTHNLQLRRLTLYPIGRQARWCRKRGGSLVEAAGKVQHFPANAEISKIVSRTAPQRPVLDEIGPDAASRALARSLLLKVVQTVAPSERRFDEPFDHP